MATSGTVNEGLDDIGDAAYISGQLTLVAYTNTPNSLSATSTFASLTQPSSSNGYSPITLDGTWTSTNGVMTYTHSTPPHPRWNATGSWSATVTGVAIVRGSILRHFKDLTTAFIAANGKKLEVDLSTVLG